MEKIKIGVIKNTTVRFILLFIGVFFLEMILFSSSAKAESPVITLIGRQFISVYKGEDYIDAGATAFDAEDGDLTSEIEVFNSADTNTPGFYLVFYSVFDSDDNRAEKIRFVSIADKASPIIFTDNIAPSIPVAKPAAGYYDDNQKVYLSSWDKESGLSKIYYTTNGANPDKNSLVYSSDIEVDRDMTIKAIAYDKADNKSGILEAKYEIDKDRDEDKEDDDKDNNDEKKDDDNNSSKQEVANIYVAEISSINNINDNESEGSSEEENSDSWVEGEQADVLPANNIEEAPKEKPKTLLKSNLIWLIVVFLILILILGLFLLIRRKNKNN